MNNGCLGLKNRRNGGVSFGFETSQGSRRGFGSLAPALYNIYEGEYASTGAFFVLTVSLTHVFAKKLPWSAVIPWMKNHHGFWSFFNTIAAPLGFDPEPIHVSKNCPLCLFLFGWTFR